MEGFRNVLRENLQAPTAQKAKKAEESKTNEKAEDEDMPLLAGSSLAFDDDDLQDQSKESIDQIID